MDFRCEETGSAPRQIFGQRSWRKWKKVDLFCKAITAENTQNYEASWNEGRVNEKKSLEQSIADEEKNQWRTEGQVLLVDAKRENVALQLEAAYRERVQSVYAQVLLGFLESTCCIDRIF